MTYHNIILLAIQLLNDPFSIGSIACRLHAHPAVLLTATQSQVCRDPARRCLACSAHRVATCHAAGLQASGSTTLAGLQQTASPSDQPEKENCSTSCEGDNQQAPPPNKRQKREPKDPKPPKQPKTQPEVAAAAADAGSPSDLGPPPEPTEYAKNRPRRDTNRAAMALGHTTESLELVKCCDFVGPPGSGAPLAQPFRIEVDAQVSSAMACC